MLPQTFLFTLLAFTAGLAAAAPLRFAATEMPKPDPCLPFIGETSAWLNEHWPDGVEFRYYEVSELEKAVRNREVDIVLSEAGVAARLRRDGARPLLTAVSRRHPNPERSQGSVFFVKANRSDITDIAGLKGKKLAATAEGDFTGYQAAMGEVFKHGYDPENFFRSIRMMGSSSKIAMQHVVDAVLNGEADVGVVRTCFLEDLEKLRETPIPVRVIAPYSDPVFACQRSTELYPNWSISSVPSLSAAELKKVVGILFEMPPTSNGMFWSVAPDFSSTDRLMRRLKIGSYEFLRSWTLERVWTEYKLEIVVGILLVLGLLIHVRRTQKLVEKRTGELRASYQREEELRTKNRETETQLEQFQRAAIAGQVSSLFAHEIKQPLHSVSCFSHGLLRVLEGEKVSPDLLRRGLERIEADTHEIGRIVDRVRDYARGRQTEKKPTDAVAVLRSVLQNEAAKLNVKTEVDAPDSPVLLSADDLEIRLIFANVIKNACEAAAASPDPVVKAKLTADKERLTVSVTDNGPAISDEVFSGITTPLTTTKPNGLGLGIPIATGLLNRYRGKLTLGRIPSGGLCAMIEIPIQEAQSSARSAEKEL